MRRPVWVEAGRAALSGRRLRASMRTSATKGFYACFQALYKLGNISTGRNSGDQIEIRIPAQSQPVQFVIGHYGRYPAPKSRRMIRLAQMRQLVDDDVIDQ